MANKPELKRAVAGSKIKANDYNYNFDRLNDFIDEGVAQNAVAFYEVGREFKKGQWVLTDVEGVFSIYESLIDGNLGKPVTDGEYWKYVFDANSLPEFEKELTFRLNNTDLPVFCANSGNVDENGNADLLYLLNFGENEIPWQNPTVKSATEYGSITSDRGNLLFLVDGSTGLTRIDGNTYHFTWEFPSDKRIFVNQFKVFWGCQDAVSGLPDGATLYLYKNNELVATHILTRSFVYGWITNTFEKTECDKIVFAFSGYNLSDVYSRIGEIQLSGTEIVTVSTSTQAFFKVGGSYGNLTATSTEKTFEKSYLEPITAETDGTYNVFVSENENAYALANTISRQKTEPSPKFVQPILTANGTMGGASFAVSSNVAQYGSNDVYAAFDGNTASTYGFHSISGTKTGYIDIYNPIALNITNFKIYNQNYANRASSAGIIYGSNDGAEWTQITTYTNSVQTANSSWDIDLSSNDNYYKYYRIESTAGGSDSYWVIIEIEITATKEQNDVWLNTSVQPYKAYKFNGTEWVDFNDVPIGSMVVEGGVITSVETLPYNNAEVNEPSDTRPAVVVETYQNGSSWYRIWSDGWCEQGGFVDATAVATITINLLKPYANSNYSISLTNRYNGTGSKSPVRVQTVSYNNFVYWSENANGDAYWRTAGYIK